MMTEWAETLTLLGREWRLERHDAKEAVYGTRANLLRLGLKRHRDSVSVALYDNFRGLRATAEGANLGIALSRLEIDLALPDAATPVQTVADPDSGTTIVFTNLVLALMRRSRGDALEALEDLGTYLRDERFPNVPAVARFVCELEEAER